MSILIRNFFARLQKKFAVTTVLGEKGSRLLYTFDTPEKCAAWHLTTDAEYGGHLVIICLIFALSKPLYFRSF